MDFGRVKSCGFILPLRKNMITHSFTFNYAPNFEKVGRAYCFGLVCLSVRLLTFEP